MFWTWLHQHPRLVRLYDRLEVVTYIVIGVPTTVFALAAWVWGWKELLDYLL